MRSHSNLRTFAIIQLMIVTALSLTGVIANSYATPLIFLSISVLFFVIAYESITKNKYRSARRFIIVGVILSIAALVLFFIGNF